MQYLAIALLLLVGCYGEQKTIQEPVERIERAFSQVQTEVMEYPLLGEVVLTKNGYPVCRDFESLVHYVLAIIEHDQDSYLNMVDEGRCGMTPGGLEAMVLEKGTWWVKIRTWAIGRSPMDGYTIHLALQDFRV